MSQMLIGIISEQGNRMLQEFTKQFVGSWTLDPLEVLNQANLAASERIPFLTEPSVASDRADLWSVIAELGSNGSENPGFFVSIHVAQKPMKCGASEKGR